MAEDQAPAREAGSLRLVGTLAIAGLVSGLVLVGAYLSTAPRIAHNRAERLRAAVFKVLPAAENIDALELVDGRLVHAELGGAGDMVYACRDSAGELVGFAVPAQGAGFMDTVKVLYGFDATDRVIVGFQVLESRETPGLGDKIAFDPAFMANFEALVVEPVIEPVKGDKSEANQVDCITGATISSEAVVEILNRSIERWLPVLTDPAAVPAPAPVAAAEGEAP